MKYRDLFAKHAFVALFSSNAVLRSPSTPTWHVGRSGVGPTLCGLKTGLRWNVEDFPQDHTMCSKCRKVIDRMRSAANV